MSETRNPPKDLWWYCHACGMSNGPRDTAFCNGCGRNKVDAMDKDRWVDNRFVADAAIVAKRDE